MVSDGDGWLGVGPIRGPRHLMTLPSNGKSVRWEDAAWAEVPPTACSCFTINDSVLTADAIPTGLFLPGLK
jgi:hypothetical protein